MSKPIISIIIPCYNDGQYLREAIESVEKCDSKTYELIIVNDGSTDIKTIEVLKDLEIKGYQIINQQNKGLGFARNVGIENSSGDFILPLDSDNKIYPEYLTESLKIFEKFADVAVVYGKRDFFGATTSQHKLPQGSEFNLSKIILGNYIDACAVIRKSAIIEVGGYSTNFPHQGIEDWDLWINLAKTSWKFHFVDKILYSYRIRLDSMSNSATQKPKFSENLVFFYAKHSLLLKEIIETQNQEIHEIKSSIPYFIRKKYREFRYGNFKSK